MRIIRGHRPAGVLFLSILLLSSTIGYGQEIGQEIGQESQEAKSPSFPHLVLVDLRDVLGAPLSWRGPQWERFSFAVAGVGAAALLDRTVRDAERRDHNRVTDQVAKDFERFGTTYALGVVGSFYLVGLVRDDARARSVGEDGAIASLIAGGIVTPVLKFAVGRVRPRDTDKTFDVKPFSGSSSFPSGHATEAFAVASVIATRYDSGWIKGVAYGSATLVGFARIHHQAHFLSDVTAGALIGTAVGRAVVHRNGQERRRLTVAPLLGPRDQPGVAVALSF
ncbi:MAG TPA: phosphatase PAP2 family protein [Thermoanaerobaculia bacterium]|nr:phosphatase PAP2 family protein [Thermoanaerobaculia bacterium]